MATSINRTIPVIVAFVAGIAIGYFASMLPPEGDGMSGTVAPAERYRASSITEDDIVLGDQALVELMQTDAFTTVMNDPELAGLLANSNFRMLFGDLGFNGLMANAEFRTLDGE